MFRSLTLLTPGTVFTRFGGWIAGCLLLGLFVTGCGGGDEVRIVLRVDPTVTDADGELLEFPLFVTENGVQEEVGTIVTGDSLTIPGSDVDRQFQVQRKDPLDPLCDYYGGGTIPADEVEVFFWIDLSCA